MKKKFGAVLLVVALALSLGVVTAVSANAGGALPRVKWLPPLANQGEFQLKDGSTLPIKFALNDTNMGDFVEDTGVKVDVNEVLFRDGFNDGDADGWDPVTDDTSWSVTSDGVLQCAPAIPYPRILATETLGYTNYMFEADARVVSGRGYALIFRAAGYASFYSFQYQAGTSGLSLRLYQFTGFPTGADVAPIVPYSTDNDWHNLKVRVEGTNIKCYVDGNMVFNVTDTASPTPVAGGIGFRTWSSTTAEFDNVMVTDLPATKTFSYGEGDDNVRISYDTVFSDDFARAEIGTKWQWVSGNWAIEDDLKDTATTKVLSGEGGGYVGEIAVAGDGSWSNYVFEFDVKKVSGPYFQVVFGYQDLNNHYLLEPSSDQVHIALFKKIAGSGYQEMGTPRPSQEANLGVWYHYKIVFTPSNIQIFCNGVEKFNVPADPSLTSGRIGVGAGMWGPSHAHFDNISVKVPHYIANLHTKENGMVTGDYLITVWSGSGDELGTYLFDLTDAIQGKGRGKGKA